MCLSIQVRRPDVVLEESTHAGHEYVITHNGMGSRCAYVRVEAGHPWFGGSIWEEPLLSIDAHGGITFSEADMECNAPGDDNAWWIGIDFAHLFDVPDSQLPMEDSSSERLQSALDDFRHSMVGGQQVRVWTQDLVRAEIQDICEQAAAAHHALLITNRVALPA